MPATRVPEARGSRTGPIAAMRRAGSSRLLRDSLTRFKEADGFSHVRSLAFQLTLTAIPMFIALVGFATDLSPGGLRDAFRSAMLDLTPGQASQTVSQAFKQGSQAASGSSMALVLGAAAGLISATSAMVYLERGANRIYGIESDRPPTERYLRAFLIAISSGFLLVIAFVLFLAGSSLGSVAGSKELWTFVRWPVTLGCLLGGFVLTLKQAPARKQPSLRWIFVGAGVGTLLWGAFTMGLLLYLEISRGFGRAYGPLAGVMGMLFWTFLSALAMFLAVAFTAQLEAVKAGRAQPSR